MFSFTHVPYFSAAETWVQSFLPIGQHEYSTMPLGGNDSYPLITLCLLAILGILSRVLPAVQLLDEGSGICFGMYGWRKQKGRNGIMGTTWRKYLIGKICLS